MAALQQVSWRRTRRAAAGAVWKQKHLAMELSGLPNHPSKNAKLEQYATDGDIAARWLLGINVQDTFAEMEKGVVDLGAGNGILGIGALLLGAPRVTFVEVDAAAVDALEDALQAQDLSARARVLRCDVAEVADDPDCACDLVLMNPPWGQQRRSADRPFLQVSIALARTSVHLMHSAGAVHVEPWAQDHGWQADKWPGCIAKTCKDVQNLAGMSPNDSDFPKARGKIFADYAGSKSSFASIRFHLRQFTEPARALFLCFLGLYFSPRTDLREHHVGQTPM
ncbi:unnamed protein product [Symbiodinium natans]|uniref:Methyltransferase small domain-containing protein n=1 Tax=Symbiodinium natans TaxID=878477 RepID=A0A812TDL0_9DINO|nr:unnamed protein product [Symbiodinium natans]